MWNYLIRVVGLNLIIFGIPVINDYLLTLFNILKKEVVLKVKAGFFSNKMMNTAVVICSVVQASVVIFPSLARLFGVTVLNSTQWLVAVLLSLVTLFIGELGKIIFYRQNTI